jgi:hypothetical protein
MAEERENPRTDERADDSDDHVTDDSTRAFARNDHFRKRSGHDSDDDPTENSHDVPTFRKPFVRSATPGDGEDTCAVIP